jgi:UDP-galactopyranose mutase
MSRILVVGAGFSGAVVARQLAEAGRASLVIDERDHVAGNCHTSVDAESGIMVHRYGPHIFHTDNEEVWTFVSRFCQWATYRHAVYSTVKDRVFSLPVNLLTINQFFGKAMTPEEARVFIAGLAIPSEHPANFREQGLNLVGEALYDAFFRHYTTKQWGAADTELPASILRRLPLRFSYDANYFHHQRQAMPLDGYTAVVDRMLAHPLIEVRLGVAHESLAESFAHTFYSGPLDRYFGYRLGRLGYRSLRFEELRLTGDALGCPVMNFPDADVPWTRMTEHRHLSPWRKPTGDTTIVWREYSEATEPGMTPYYPLRLVGDERMLRDYVGLANAEAGVTFLGRLGCYAYIDMDAAVGRALETAKVAIDALGAHRPLPAFVHDPLGKH